MKPYAIRLTTLLCCLLIVPGIFAEKKSISVLLYETISAKGVTAAVEQYHTLRDKESAQYTFAEGELNNLGYRLLGEGKQDAAIEIFALNAKMYPASPNVYDSYAEALMRSGNNEAAVKNYRIALEKLESANLPDQQKQFLTGNANAKIELLTQPNRIHSTAIKDLISEGAEHPFGRLHPEAPPETKHWGRLAGVWQCTNYANVNGQWVGGWPATWAWRYILDGFAVQDTWMQKAEDAPPTNAAPHRDFAGTNLRIFDRSSGKWDVVWMHNGQIAGGSGTASSHLEAVSTPEEIIMTPVGGVNQAGQMTRVVFYNMTDNSFEWKSDISQDEGVTWTTQFKISGKRIR